MQQTFKKQLFMDRYLCLKNEVSSFLLNNFINYLNGDVNNKVVI